MKCNSLCFFNGCFSNLFIVIILVMVLVVFEFNLFLKGIFLWIFIFIFCLVLLRCFNRCCVVKFVVFFLILKGSFFLVLVMVVIFKFGLFEKCIMILFLGFFNVKFRMLKL